MLDYRAQAKEQLAALQKTLRDAAKAGQKVELYGPERLPNLGVTALVPLEAQKLFVPPMDARTYGRAA